MARTLSKMVALGTKAIPFLLPDTVSEQTVSLDDICEGKPFVVMFICNHCPFVIHLHKGLQELVSDYNEKGIQFIAINSNDVKNYPEDSPVLMTKLFEKLGFIFPYLFDESQEVAQAYDATCTPDFYVFDKNKALVYRGQFDDSRPGNEIAITGKSIREAMDCLLKDLPIDTNQKASLGCNIKFR